MIRLNLIVEGQTEETFVRRVLVPHLSTGFDVYLNVRCVETGRDRRKNRIYRGGLSSYKKLKNDLLRWIGQEKGAGVVFTTMIDLYALPSDFPDYKLAVAESDARKKTALLEDSFRRDVESSSNRRIRFVPYIQLHEFETLLLSKPEAISIAVGDDSQISGLKSDVAGFDDVELIDGGRETAPSKRIINRIPEYEDQKAFAGPIIADKIGLEHLRSRCEHFNEWLTVLESFKNDG